MITDLAQAACIPMPLQIVIDDAVLREEAAHIEIALHGVGHEYWRDGRPTRAEWYDENGVMRPRRHVLAHLEAYSRIMEQNGLGPFPTSFVPAAFRYCYGDGPRGLAAILREWGIAFISTPFASARFAEPPQTEVMGIDRGVPTADRGVLPPIPWHRAATEPAEPPGPILGLHWPNTLHRDPRRNHEVVERWVDLLAEVGGRVERVLSPDTESFQTQLAHHLTAKVCASAGRIELDFSGFERLAAAVVRNELCVKLTGVDGLQFSGDGLDIRAVVRDPGTGTYALRVEPHRERTKAAVQILKATC